MGPLPTTEGSVDFTIPSTSEVSTTSYKIIGEFPFPPQYHPPLILLHGGPGAGHEYLLPFTQLWTKYSIPLIFYDQIGCAASTHFRHHAGDDSFWNESLFVLELNNLISHLGLSDDPGGFDLLGQSWGGMLAAAFAATQPRGLKRLVLANGVSDKPTEIASTLEKRKMLPEEVRKGLEEDEREGRFDGEGYARALRVFGERWISSVDPLPDERKKAAEHMREDKTVYGTMYGPGMLTPTGNLMNWTCIPRLPSIEVPTLVYNGEFDTSSDATTAPFFELIPKVRWVTFAGARHHCHLESEEIRNKVFTLVGSFLAQKV